MILLSFDIEEFDLPREQGVEIDFQTSMEVSKYGTLLILDILKEKNVIGTFFVTGRFAQNAPEIVKRMLSEGHEIASHGVDHFHQEPSDCKESKRILEEIIGEKICGFRQPRMGQVSSQTIKETGYLYNASINPAIIPGRYINCFVPRTCFIQDDVLQIPASVTPILRFPLFWLSNHLLPCGLYYWMIRRTIKHDGYFNTYMHPWEFFPIGEHPEWKIPGIILKNSGKTLETRLNGLIDMLKHTGKPFGTYRELAEMKLAEKKLS